MHNTFRHGENNYHKAIITGISRILNVGFYTGMNNFQIISSTEYVDAYPFYGFTREEIIDLMKITNRKLEDISEIEEWYDGYSSYHHLDHTLFNPISVINYLHTGRVECYCINTGGKFFEGLPRMFEHYQIAIRFQPSLNKHGAILIRKNSLNPTTYELGNISAIIHGENLYSPLPDEYVDCAIGVLFNTGYLSLNNTQPSDETVISVKIPNNEVRIFLLKAYEVNGFLTRSLSHYSEDTAAALLSYLRNSNGNKFEILKTSIVELFRKSGPYASIISAMDSYMKNDKIFVTEKIGLMHQYEAAAHFLMLQPLSTLQRKGLINLGSEVIFRHQSPIISRLVYNYRIDLIAYDEENVLIIEMKSDKKCKMREILQQAEQYMLLFKNAPVFKSYKLLAVNVHDNENIFVEQRVFNSEEGRICIEKWESFEKEAMNNFGKSGNIFNREELFKKCRSLDIKTIESKPNEVASSVSAALVSATHLVNTFLLVL